MNNLLRQGSAWLVGQNVAHMSDLVTYTRPGVQSIGPIAAKLGKTPYESVTSDGMVFTAEARDFLIRSADLVIGGAQVDPERGDTITEADETVWTVMLIPGGQCFARVEFGAMLRIHTKRTD